MSAGLSGKLVLIAITVTATAGGFALGYFVGKNAPSVYVQPLVQAGVVSPAEPDNRGAVDEIRRPQDSPSPSPGQTRRNDKSLPGAMSVQTQEQKPAVPPAVADQKTALPDTQRGGTAKEGHPEATTRENKSVEPKAGDEPLYTVQVGAFKSRREADALKKGLEEKGLKARRQKAGEKERALYKVMVGEFSQRKEAEVLAVKLKKTEGLKAFVTTKN